jgi:WD40 repeat protein
LWNTTDRQNEPAFGDLRDGQEQVETAVLSPDGRSVVANKGGDIETWSVGDGKELFHFTPASSLNKLSTDGRTVIGEVSNHLEIWETATGRKIAALPNPDGFLPSITMSPSLRLAIVCDGNPNAKLWDLKKTSFRILHGDEGGTDSGVFSPNERTLATVSLNDGITLWNLTTGEKLRSIPAVGVLSIVFSADRKYLLTGSMDNAAQLWSIESGNKVEQFVGHDNWINSVGFSPDGVFVLTGSKDGTAKLWRRSSGETLSADE